MRKGVIRDLRLVLWFFFKHEAAFLDPSSLARFSPSEMKDYTCLLASLPSCTGSEMRKQVCLLYLNHKYPCSSVCSVCSATAGLG